jgi:hypothetical protein
MAFPQITPDGWLDEPETPIPDEERTVDGESGDDELPDHLHVSPEIPVPDVIDQRRSVVVDDDDQR